MQGQELWLIKIFISVLGFLGLLDGIITAIVLEYLLKFRPGLAEKYVLKKDFAEQMEMRKRETARVEADIKQIHSENREDHGKIFDELREIRQDMNSQFVNVIKEFNKCNNR